jgi:hypothetical protein
MVFYTVQTMFISGVFFGAAAVAEVSLFTAYPLGHLFTVSYTCALVISADCIILTVLYLGLNWFEKKWQEGICKPWCEHWSPHFAAVSLLTHIYSLPLGLLDLYVVKDWKLLVACRPALGVNIAALAVYAFLYIVMLIVAHQSNGGHYAYPFCYDLDKLKPYPLGWAAFYIVLLIVLSLLVWMLNSTIK